jgi:hypothetical protein
VTAPYRSDRAADPELFERLMRERYGPLDKVLAERERPHPLAPAQRPLMAPTYQSRPDPDAAQHLAALKEAIARPTGGPASTGAVHKRTPPAPGIIWCCSCDGWCTLQGICECNNT